MATVGHRLASSAERRSAAVHPAGRSGAEAFPQEGDASPTCNLHSIRCVPKAWLRSQNRARTEKVALLTATLDPKHHRAYRAAHILRRAAQRTCTLRRGRRYLPGTG